MEPNAYSQSHYTNNEYNGQKQSSVCGRVPSNWLSLPVAEHASGYLAPPCNKDIRGMIYGPISGNSQRLEIRLIEIEGSDDEYGRMSCLLRSYALTQAPNFHALSYCWNDGSGSSCKTVLVNGFEFRIQSSLWHALHMLRKHGHTTVWADAICLNQQDGNEKAQQVPLMRLIYQQAAEVVIWLGNESNGSAEFLDLLRTITQSETMQNMRNYWKSQLPASRDENRNIYPANVREHLISECLSQKMNSDFEKAGGDNSDNMIARIGTTERCHYFQALLIAFFDRPYWRRTWIVQEIASARKLRILCGDSEVDWDDMTSLLILDDGTLRWDSEAAIASQNMIWIDKLRYKIINDIPIGFLTALQRSYGCEAGDMRDKFYALLGLCWNGECLIPYVSYAKDVTLNRIMFDLTRKWTDSGNLDIICLQPHIGDNDYKLPSWLPKWLTVGRSTMNERLVDHIEKRRPMALCTSYGHSWTATRRSRGVPHFDDSHRIMVVKGKIIDVVDGLSAACDHFWKDTDLRKCWDSRSQAPETVDHMKNIRRDLYWTFNVYKERDGDSLSDQALVLDCLFSEETTEFWRTADFDCHIKWLEQIRNFRIFGRPFHQWILDRSKYRNRAKVKLHNALLKRPEDRVVPATQEEKLIQAFGHVFDDLRRLMTTTGGRVGWAHPSARPGDLIVLLEGCDLPVILAKSGIPFQGHQTYAVVGDAYVHGIMQGELWGETSQKLNQIFLR